MMQLFRMFVVLMSAITLAANAETQTRCMGGDGGVPMSDISSGFKFDNDIVPTDGLVKEYLHWDQKNTVVYRNQRNEVRSLDLNHNFQRFLGQSGKMISRIVDPLEKFISTAHDSWFLDASKQDPKWVHYDTPAPISRHIFWQGDVLYSLAAETTGSGNQRLNVLSYHAGQTFSQSCVIHNSLFQKYYVADGHEYPYVYLYSLNSNLTGTRLHQYRVKLYEMGVADGKCQLEDLKYYPEPLPGDVKGVFHFKNVPGTDKHVFAISVDHPSRSILYDDGSTCKYLNLKGREAMILNASQPVVATWAKGEGLGLHYLDSEKEVRFMKGILSNSVTQDNLWMTDNGRRLFVAAQPPQCASAKASSDCDGRLILKLDLPESPKPE